MAATHVFSPLRRCSVVACLAEVSESKEWRPAVALEYENMPPYIWQNERPRALPLLVREIEYFKDHKFDSIDPSRGVRQGGGRCEICTSTVKHEESSGRRVRLAR